MGQYAEAAVIAYGIIRKNVLLPEDAWNEAIASKTPSPSSRKKTCPRLTFLALAESGYLKGVNAKQSVNNDEILRARAIEGADFILSHPFATHRHLSDHLGYADKQGSYDILIELSKRGILQRSK